MSELPDYSQPAFFRFGRDSLFLVAEALRLTKFQDEIPRLLELGAGSGIVSCEISRQRSVGAVHVVEAQPEWKPHLETNLQHFGRFAEAPVLHWQTVGEFNPTSSIQADVIVTNPPYFDPARGRPSPDSQRNIAHRLVLDPWDSWLACLCRSLAPGGEAFMLQKDPGPLRGEWTLPENYELKHEVRSGPMRLIALRRLNVE